MEPVATALSPAAPAGQTLPDGEAERFLSIYMNDQLALGVLWREIARRSQKSNDGTPLGDALSRVAQGIAEDVETFKEIMDRLGISRRPLKPALAVVAERFGRLKLNGRVREYSPLSRFEELDFLRMGIDGKLVLWENLRDLAGLGNRLSEFDFDALLMRARRQRADIEPFRAEAGRQAFITAPAAAG